MKAPKAMAICLFIIYLWFIRPLPSVQFPRTHIIDNAGTGSRCHVNEKLATAVHFHLSVISLFSLVCDAENLGSVRT